ncbi:MAG: hypothetical protein IT204_05385 [Fimbriimonadaceae bacterium]|nr:hypothetical protein [Fimbriimonadaceae bacterium]
MIWLSTFTAALSTLAAPAEAVLLEIWRDVPGERVVDFTAGPRATAVADEIRWVAVPSVESLGNQYAARLTFRLLPPASGEYRLLLASDDGGELWVSRSGDPAAAELVATVNGWSDPLSFGGQANQRSQPLALTAGQAVWVQATWKQGGGGNHCAVAWEGPGLPRAVPATSALQRVTMSAAQTAKLAATAKLEAERQARRRQVEAYLTRGETIPVTLATQLPLTGEGLPANDTGVNVLVDQAHQTQFVVLWGFRGQLREAGYRAASSAAALSSVLPAGSRWRVRLAVDELEPYAWWPAERFNVVVTGQQDHSAQPYSPAEQTALRDHLAGGGGLLVFGGRCSSAAQARDWSLNQLLAAYGGGYSHETDRTADGATWAALQLDATWEVLRRGEGGRPIRARRPVGRGRLLLAEGQAPFNAQGNDPAEVKAARQALLRETVAWLAAGLPPVGGTARWPANGGVGIFPELEQSRGGIVVYYAANQKPEVVRCITENVPKAADALRAWLPTKEHAEPYTIVICAGGGGGWAINPRPKSAAVIDYDPVSLLGVFGHEMAHTMPGPGNDAGEVCGSSPHHNQGEAHAGWFQGKILAMFGQDVEKSNRNCNSFRDLERQQNDLLDFTTQYENEAGRQVWGYGGSWTKMWWVWQKLDDRYGPTWYPRWYWVRSTRWAADPGHRESWDEMVESLSIAVGEDLFPWFGQMGTRLQRQRLERIEFQGRTMELAVAPLDLGPGGKVNLEPIGDYRQPLKPRG